MNDGRWQFARVTVEVTPAVTCSTAVEALPDQNGYRPDPAWLTAAGRGARYALVRLATDDRLKHPWAVRVVTIEGSIADTDSRAVFCSTVMAVWEAVAPDAPPPLLADGDRLRLLFPSPTPSPV